MVMAVRQFVQKDVVPLAAEQEDAAGGFPVALVERLAELGVFGALAPVEYGGLGLALTTSSMIIEELARGWAMLGALVAGHLATADAIARYAGPAERGRLLPAMVRAERLGAVALGAPAGARRAGGGWGLAGRAPLVAAAGPRPALHDRCRPEGRRTAFLAAAGVVGLEVGPGRPTPSGCAASAPPT